MADLKISANKINPGCWIGRSDCNILMESMSHFYDLLMINQNAIHVFNFDAEDHHPQFNYDTPFSIVSKYYKRAGDTTIRISLIVQVETPESLPAAGGSGFTLYFDAIEIGSENYTIPAYDYNIPSYFDGFYQYPKDYSYAYDVSGASVGWHEISLTMTAGDDLGIALIQFDVLKEGVFENHLA